MNSKRRADLQRKLSLNAVRRPPAGLVDRIKADIPKYLEAEPARGRFVRALPFSMRIAASLLLVVTSVAVALVLMNAPRGEEKSASIAPGPFAPAARSLPQARTTTEATEEVRLDIAQDTAALDIPTQIALMPPPPAAPRAAAAERRQVEAEQPVQSGVENDTAEGVVTGVVGGSAANIVREEAAMQDFAAPEPAPVAPPTIAAPTAAAAPAPPPVPAQAPAPAPAPARIAAVETQAAKKEIAAGGGEVFGISIDPQNFHRIRRTLESGGRPASAAVDVEAIVNYFAGPPEKRPRRGVRLDVEASPAAIEAEGDNAILRFSIDTPSGNPAAPPAASDVRLDVDFNESVVAHSRFFGGSAPLGREAVLRPGTSVTGLYALALRPNLSATQLVATVRLHYTVNGKPETLTRHVRAGDLAKNWQRASRRHRLASLGAVWGETLKSSAPGFDVARRAEELATQDPKDARAKELAAAAQASADGSR
jgi:hypothetical protein